MPKERGTLPYVFYVIVLLASVAALWGTLQLGEALTPTLLRPVQAGETTFTSAFRDFNTSVTHHIHSTIGVLLLQILIILLVARAMGWLFRKLHQPAVIGEIVAGILLGPSLFGRVAPGAFTSLFPVESLPNIQLLSNFGLILFMFAIGMELRLGDIRRQLKSSLIISHAGIFIPFALSLPLSYAIYTEYASGLTPFMPFALFIGISMSITAFPVLARIIQENHLQRSYLGKLSLSTAAAGDITAWLLLAAIIAVSQSGSIWSTGYNLLFLVLYLLIMFGIIRPLFKVAGKVYNNTEVISHGLVGVIFILLLLSSYITELLSMHALFGAFMLGLVMPEELSFRKILTDKIEDVSLMLFLPLFFVSSGLQTELGLIDSWATWGLLGLFTLVAVMGKVGGTYFAARCSGQGAKDSLYLGAFMNTRGLMELVVLGIGYEMKILPPTIYAVLVLMTVVTTVMTMPLVHLINACVRLRARRSSHITSIDKQAGAKVLLSFGRPSSGATLLHLTNQLLRRGAAHPNVTALHITTDQDITSIEADKFYQDSFTPILRVAEELNQPLDTDYIVADEVESTILGKLTSERYNLLIVGAGGRLSSDEDDREASTMRQHLSRVMGTLPMRTTESLLSIHSMLRDKMAFFVHRAPCSVGILLSRSTETPKHILLCVHSASDLRLLPYARTMAENNRAHLRIALSSSIARDSFTSHPGEELLLLDKLGSLTAECDFVVVSYTYWQETFDTCEELLTQLPSTLILHLK